MKSCRKENFPYGKREPQILHPAGRFNLQYSPSFQFWKIKVQSIWWMERLQNAGWTQCMAWKTQEVNYGKQQPSWLIKPRGLLTLFYGAEMVPEDSRRIIRLCSCEKWCHIKSAENTALFGILHHNLRNYKSTLFSLFPSKSGRRRKACGGSNPSISASSEKPWGDEKASGPFYAPNGLSELSAANRCAGFTAE